MTQIFMIIADKSITRRNTERALRFTEKNLHIACPAPAPKSPKGDRTRDGLPLQGSGAAVAALSIEH
jgi:hypothetical protein